MFKKFFIGFLVIGLLFSVVGCVDAKVINASYTMHSISASVGDVIQFLPINFLDESSYLYCRYEEEAWVNGLGEVAQWCPIRMVEFPKDFIMFPKKGVPKSFNLTVIGSGELVTSRWITDGPCHDHEYKMELFVS